jgi:hypothetical protein
MSLFDSVRPTWIRLIEKLKDRRQPIFQVVEVTGNTDLQAAKNTLNAFASKHRSFSMILVKD